MGKISSFFPNRWTPMSIAIVIPAYNEERHIQTVLSQLPRTVAGFSVQPIVVNDGSYDRTSALARQVDGVVVVDHCTNLGKGAAAKTGCDAAHRLGAEIFVLMDGDNQHRGEDVDRLLQPLFTPEGRPVDGLVVGTRSLAGSMPFMMRAGNRILNGAARTLFDIRTSDTQSGFRAFTRQVYPKIRWASAHYAMETEMLILAVANRVKVHEVAIPTVYHDNYKGTTPLDGLRIFGTLVRWRVSLARYLQDTAAWYAEEEQLALQENTVIS
jgi:glycosyltransferase involved in cell wall biosynthesis